jgi:hypothetical protein
MKAVVIVPFRSGDRVRDDLWQFCRSQWERCALIVADAPGETFGCGQSRNAGAAGDWDAALFTDADIVFGDIGQAQAALELAFSSDSYVTPFDHRHWLNRQDTEQVIAGSDLDAFRTAPADTSWLSAFAISRVLWDRVGGFDERFAGCDGEDVAFLHACATLGTLARVPGCVFHLWHGDDRDRLSDPDESNRALEARYVAASGDRAAMLALIGER